MPAEATNVKVAVRCRPQNRREKDNNAENAIRMENKKVTYIKDPKTGKEQQFTFDHSYWLDTEQESVYQDLGEPILTKALEGFNGTIFAYGQTGAGKSFSMMGAPDFPGIIPRLNEDLFKRVDDLDDREFLISVSYLEIYQEVIHDLLNPSDRKLQIRQHPTLGIYVDQLAEIVVRSNEDIQRLMAQGNKVRQVASTNMNDTSSRSHAVFTLKIAQRSVDEDNNQKGWHAKINLVDLAGSERQASTGATGDRLKEGAAINKSLAALGNVINALADAKKGHIPYRDSKLTRLLQESLGGNSITVMLAALSPADINFEETLSTLHYANRAKNIVNDSKKNEDANQRIIRELREEIASLRQMLSKMAGGGEIDVEKMQRMEKMMEDLEHAKKQSWENQEKQSKAFEEERISNLQNRGLLESVMESIRKDNDKIAAELRSISEEKEKLIKEFKHQKLRVAKLKASLEEDIQHYSAACADGRVDDADTKDLLEKIGVKKNALKEESDKLRQAKDKLKENAEQIRMQKDELRTHHFILAEDSEIRKAIADDEREKLAMENEKLLVQERKRLEAEMEKEKERIRLETEAKYAGTAGAGGNTISMEEYLALEMKLIQEKADKELLITKVGILKQENEVLSNALEEESLRSQLELEKQQIQHFQVFRKYREIFEDEKKKIEKRYMELLDETIQDAIFLSTRNQELEEVLAARGIGV